MTSPLGRYAQPVAAIVAIGVIAAYLLATILNLPSATQLLPLASLALGAVFGAATAVNGYKVPLAAVQAQLDTHLAAQPDAAAIVRAAGMAASSSAPVAGGSSMRPVAGP
ncbi:MAG TPA: hypothetical protein VMU66_05640 [Gaiellales bacterium]|nr:hypothetical protein [Gaiellales bacterium]